MEQLRLAMRNIHTGMEAAALLAKLPDHLVERSRLAGGEGEAWRVARARRLA